MTRTKNGRSVKMFIWQQLQVLLSSNNLSANIIAGMTPQIASKLLIKETQISL